MVPKLATLAAWDAWPSPGGAPHYLQGEAPPVLGPSGGTAQCCTAQDFHLPPVLGQGRSPFAVEHPGAGDPFGIEPKRQQMAVVFLIDRTFEAFLQKVVDAVVGKAC